VTHSAPHGEFIRKVVPLSLVIFERPNEVDFAFGFPGNRSKLSPRKRIPNRRTHEAIINIERLEGMRTLCHQHHHVNQKPSP